MSARDRKIFREFNGRNIKSLCAKYRVSNQRLYQIVAGQRADETNDPPIVHRDLFLVFADFGKLSDGEWMAMLFHLANLLGEREPRGGS